MKNKTALHKVAAYDLRVGNRQVAVRYLVSVAVIVFLCGLLAEECKIEGTSGSFLDLCFSFFGGIEEYNRLDRNSQFRLPVFLMLHQFFMLFLVGSYPKENMEKNGIHVFTECGDRIKWWLGKCTWVAMNISLYYAVTYMFLKVMAVGIAKNTNATGNSEILIQAGGMSGEFLANLFLLPLLASLAMGMIQLMAGIFLKPIWGYVIICFWVVLSAYKTNVWFIGNHIMMLRNRFFSAGKIGLMEGVCVDLFIIVMCLILGSLFMQRYDIISKGE